MVVGLVIGVTEGACHITGDVWILLLGYAVLFDMHYNT